jgi:hypothetical protein
LDGVKVILFEKLCHFRFSILARLLGSFKPRGRDVLTAWTKQKESLDDASGHAIEKTRFPR